MKCGVVFFFFLSMIKHMRISNEKNSEEMKAYISKKVWSLESKLWSVICSQNSRNSSFVMEADVMPRRRDNASNNSPANSFDSFIPTHHFCPKFPHNFNTGVKLFYYFLLFSIYFLFICKAFKNY